MKRVGIIGCGGIARAHAEGYRATGKTELEVHGTEGNTELWWDGGTFHPASGEVENYSPPEDPVAKDPFAAQLNWFLDCVSGEKEPRATDTDGLRALEVIEAAYNSAAEPPWISLKEKRGDVS